jgi:hypothetical protein
VDPATWPGGWNPWAHRFLGSSFRWNHWTLGAHAKQECTKIVWQDSSTPSIIISPHRDWGCKWLCLKMGYTSLMAILVRNMRLGVYYFQTTPDIKRNSITLSICLSIYLPFRPSHGSIWIPSQRAL